MTAAGLGCPRSAIATSLEQAPERAPGDPAACIVRPAYTLGGRGGGIAGTVEEFERIVALGIEASPIGQVLIDESVIGWGEFELEVMRDRADNVVIVCSIENVDPMGVHTGDSVTVAPQQTLTDHLYQRLRDQAIAVIRAVGVETGGSNVQFAVNPDTEEILVIEMNPRVSRSSALASKATGFPIAKIAARLAVGYRLDEIDNDITGVTPACFEPTIDYVVVKWPRFAFEKFPGVDPTLSTHMKSVGEAMAIGRTFQQAFAKALRSRELDKPPCPPSSDGGAARRALHAPAPSVTRTSLELLRRGVTSRRSPAQTAIDPWFLHEFSALARDPDARLRWRARLPRGRHLRRRVLRADALLLLRLGAAHRLRHASVPAPPRSAAASAVDRHPRLRAEPDRAGDRVRLLLRSRRHDRARVRPRRRDDQLQPRDRLHRLRHLRPPLLRAAHDRGRARRRRRRAARTG